MGKFRLRPNIKDIDLSTLNVDHVEFLCNMGVINKIIAKKNGVVWDDHIQESFDEKVKVYFLVKKNLEYAVLYGTKVDEMINDKKLIVNHIISDKGRKCINHYIKSLE